MTKRSKKQTKKQQPGRASEKKQARKEKKLEVVLPAPEDLLRSQEEAEIEPELGNNGEPIPVEINEDAGKDSALYDDNRSLEPPDEPMIELQVDLKTGSYHGESGPAKFDPKKFVEDLLKKHGA